MHKLSVPLSMTLIVAISGCADSYGRYSAYSGYAESAPASADASLTTDGSAAEVAVYTPPVSEVQPYYPTQTAPAAVSVSYGWYYDNWVPTYQGWFFYNNCWYWGRNTPPPPPPPWRPRPHRPPPRPPHPPKPAAQRPSRPSRPEHKPAAKPDIRPQRPAARPAANPIRPVNRPAVKPAPSPVKPATPAAKPSGMVQKPAGRSTATPALVRQEQINRGGMQGNPGQSFSPPSGRNIPVYGGRGR